MIGFILGIACTIGVQQSWKYRHLFPGWWAKLKAQFKGGE